MTRLVVLLAALGMAFWLAGCSAQQTTMPSISQQERGIYGGVLKLTCKIPCSQLELSVGMPNEMPHATWPIWPAANFVEE